MRYYILLLLALLVLSCGIVGPAEEWYVDLRSLSPVPEIYSEWHHEAEHCVNVLREFNDIRWFVAQSITIDGVRGLGAFDSPRDIIIKRSQLYTQSTVKHELIHYIRQARDHDARINFCSHATKEAPDG